MEELKQIHPSPGEYLYTYQFLCGWYCLVKNLPTHMLYQRPRFGFLSQDKIVPFAVELKITLIYANLWYHEAKQQHLANINLYGPSLYNPELYPIAIGDLIDLLIELAPDAMVSVEPKPLAASDYEF